jgi:hypothetical protein
MLIFLLDLLYLDFQTSRGLNLAQAAGSTIFPIPLEWLPVIGVVLLSLVTWYEAYHRIFPRRGFEIDPLGRIRLVRAIVFSILLFVLVLYVPALIGSSWFWTTLSSAGKSVVQVGDFGNALFKNAGSLFSFNQAWQYAGYQVLASGFMLLGAWAFARTTRRVRK